MSVWRRSRRSDGSNLFSTGAAWRRLSFTELAAQFFGLLPAMGAGTLANEFGIKGSPDPFGAAAAAPGLVAGVLAVWMVAGIDGKHEHPDFSEILLESLNWGKLRSATVR